MIENTRILTGTPEQVEPLLNEYLTSHPNAAVISSSVTIHQHLTPCENTLESKDSSESPSKSKKDKASSEARPIASADPAIITLSLIHI